MVLQNFYIECKFLKNHLYKGESPFVSTPLRRHRSSSATNDARRRAIKVRRRALFSF